MNESARLRILVAVATVGLAANSALAQQQSLFGGQGAAGGAGGLGAGGTAPQGATFEQGGPEVPAEVGDLSQQAGQQSFLGRGEQGQGLLGIGGNQPTGQGPGGGTPEFRPGGGEGGANSGREGSTGRSARRVPRPVARIAFDFPARPVASVARSSTVRVTSIAELRPEFAGVRIDVTPEGMAVLQGTVPDDRTAKLAATFVRMEPGVRSVRNELAVAGR